jgi:hypothetical protein
VKHANEDNYGRRPKTKSATTATSTTTKTERACHAPVMQQRSQGREKLLKTLMVLENLKLVARTGIEPVSRAEWFP